jgi:hypothetical protein
MRGSLHHSNLVSRTIWIKHLMKSLLRHWHVQNAHCDAKRCACGHLSLPKHCFEQVVSDCWKHSKSRVTSQVLQDIRQGLIKWMNNRYHQPSAGNLQAKSRGYDQPYTAESHQIVPNLIPTVISRGHQRLPGREMDTMVLVVAPDLKKMKITRRNQTRG